VTSLDAEDSELHQEKSQVRVGLSLNGFFRHFLEAALPLSHVLSRRLTFTCRGNVVKIVKEHYLRDDIWCGSAMCQDCVQSGEQVKLSDAASQYLLPDTNVVLHQMDLLESKTGAFNNIIVLQTVLQEVKHRNYKLYQRMRTLLNTNGSAFVFANEHHRDTYVERLPGESPNGVLSRHELLAIPTWLCRPERSCDPSRCQVVQQSLEG